MDANARRELNRAVQGMLGRLADDIADDARRNAPVDTGELRSSISANPVTDNSITVTASADYAGYVELGTRYMRAQPYLKPALYKKRVVT